MEKLDEYTKVIYIDLKNSLDQKYPRVLKKLHQVDPQDSYI